MRSARSSAVTKGLGRDGLGAWLVVLVLLGRGVVLGFGLLGAIDLSLLPLRPLPWACAAHSRSSSPSATQLRRLDGFAHRGHSGVLLRLFSHVWCLPAHQCEGLDSCRRRGQQGRPSQRARTDAQSGLQSDHPRPHQRAVCRYVRRRKRGLRVTTRPGMRRAHRRSRGSRGAVALARAARLIRCRRTPTLASASPRIRARHEHTDATERAGLRCHDTVERRMRARVSRAASPAHPRYAIGRLPDLVQLARGWREPSPCTPRRIRPVSPPRKTMPGAGPERLGCPCKIAS